MKPEPGMDALLQNSSKVPIPFEDQHLFRPRLPSANPRSYSRRACTDNRHIHRVIHSRSSFSVTAVSEEERNQYSFVFPTKRRECPP